MFRKMVVVGIVTVGLSNCIYHLDTAVPVDRVRYNPALIGAWVSDDSTQAVITAAGDQLYRLEYRQRNDTTPALFHGRVGQIGGRDVLEIWPAYGAADETWPVGRFLVIIDIRADEIRTWSLQPDSVLSASKRDGSDFPYLEREDDIILTAPTPTLVRYLSEYLGRPGYLADEEIWRRAKSQ